MAGWPNSYDPEYAEQAKKLCDLGATDSEITLDKETLAKDIARGLGWNTWSRLPKEHKDEARGAAEWLLSSYHIGSTWRSP